MPRSASLPGWMAPFCGYRPRIRAALAEVRAQVARYAFAQALATTRIEILAMDKDATVRGGAALLRYETRRRASC